MTHFARRLAAPALAAVLAGASACSARCPRARCSASRRDAQAEAFVQTQSQRALTSVEPFAVPGAEGAAVPRLRRPGADVGRITDFVLGKYRRTITPAQYQQFAQVFRAYATNVYESRLGEYGGERFRVTGSTVRRPGDVVVSSVVSGGQMNQPRTVQWRVIKDAAGQWRVVDVQVAGIWLAITQQQDFVATVDNAGGNINVLINQLRSQLRG
jgi:phospholipid transport system substrate-binding protein